MFNIRWPGTSISFLVPKKDIAMLTAIGCSHTRMDTIAANVAVVVTMVGRSYIGLNRIGGTRDIATVSGRSRTRIADIPGWLVLILFILIVPFILVFIVFLNATLTSLAKLSQIIGIRQPGMFESLLLGSGGHRYVGGDQVVH
jgi:hypothetical protein